MSSDVSKKFEEVSIEALRQAGCRITKQRLAVIRCLSHTKEPLTAPEVYERLKKEKKGASIDKVSVYRVLDTFAELNLVHRVSPNGAFLACNHQDCNNSFHIMSRCTGCNDVKELDVPKEVVAPLIFHMKNSQSFTPDAHLLHMDGLCSKCSD